MEGVRHRARAVIARVVPLPVPAAVLVRHVGDAVRRRDDPPHDRRSRSRGGGSRLALEHRASCRDARAPPTSPGPTTPSAARPCARWKRLHRRVRRRAEDAVGGDADRALQAPDERSARQPAAAHADRWRSVRCGASARHVAGPTTPSAVQPVAALEAPDGAPRARARRRRRSLQAEPALDLRDGRAARALLERRLRRADAGEQREQQAARRSGGESWPSSRAPTR